MVFSYMDRHKRLRRVALLCWHFVRNIAYYKAGWDGPKFKGRDEFWATVNGNFLDICILEWCKLFGERSGKHYWKKIVDDESNFKSAMFAKIGITQIELDNYVNYIKNYRDKFVAHLDSDEVMNIPQLNIALSTVIFYHGYVVKICADSSILHGLPTDLESYYKKCYSDAEKAYDK